MPTPPPSTKYPAQIDTTLTLPSVIDTQTPISAITVNRLRDAILAIESELGVKPSKIYGTVRNRLDTLEGIITGGGGGGGNVTFAGDLTGNTIFQNVIGIQGRSITPAAPSDGDVLTWNGTQWGPQSTGGTIIINGDLGGTLSSQIVIGLQGHTIANTSPVASAVPVYSTTNTRYDIRQLTLDDLGPAFAINSFAGGSTVEVGATVTNPSFTASYSLTPSSAQITNTDSIDSPHVLSSPFTNATILGSFSKNTVMSTTFTLTAIGATTKTSNSNINFFARSFIGIGTAGATSATASSTNAILVGATGTLTNNNLVSSVVGTTTATQSPSNQKIYFLCIHTSTPHTFKDNNGFTFVFNNPTTFNFTNINGVALSYDLYESTNLLSTSFAITVGS